MLPAPQNLGLVWVVESLTVPRVVTQLIVPPLAAVASAEAKLKPAAVPTYSTSTAKVALALAPACRGAVVAPRVPTGVIEATVWSWVVVMVGSGSRNRHTTATRRTTVPATRRSTAVAQ